MATFIAYGLTDPAGGFAPVTVSDQLGGALGSDLFVRAATIARANAGAAVLYGDANTTTIAIGGGASQTSVTVGKAGQAINLLGRSTVGGDTSILRSGAATGNEAVWAVERGATGDDAVLAWIEASSRFDLGFFDTAGGATAPTGALTTFANLKVGSDLTLTGTAIIASTGSLRLTSSGNDNVEVRCPNAGNIELITVGVSRWRVLGAGAIGSLIAVADDTYDIGAVGATRPRTVYVGTSVVVGSTITITTNTVSGADSATPDAITVRGGDASGGGAGANATFRAGNGNGVGAGGALAITGGTSPTGNPGNVTIRGGATSSSGSSATSGSVFITGGLNSGGSGANGGTVEITGAAGAGNGTGGDGGAVKITGGAGISVTPTVRVGGAAEIAGGPGSVIGPGGAASLVGGPGGATSGNAGGASVAGGTPIDGNGGSVFITGSAGVGTNRDGGNVTINPGAATGSGAIGALNLGTTNVSTITIGNVTGATALVYNAGSGGHAFTGPTGFFGHVVVSQQTNIVSLTDSSGGTANDTIAAITNVANAGSADVGPTADAIADLAAKVNGILTILSNLGLMA